MPELPFVERVVRRLQREIKGKIVRRVRVEDDHVVFGNVEPKVFAASLANKTVVDIGRRGKFFWLQMNKPPHPVFHFGMTGNIRFNTDLVATSATKPLKKQVEEEADPDMENSSDSELSEWPPRFWKAVFEFDKGLEMAFTDVRRFARALLFDDIQSSPAISKLGFDPLIDMPSQDEFFKMISKRNLPIKALILNQAFSAGVGNWIADEVLYQAKVHPSRHASSLTRAESNAVHFQIHNVCQVSVDANNKHSEFPADWLVHFRWGKGKKGSTKDSYGNSIVFDTVGGRTTAIVPAVQKKGGYGRDADDIEGGTKKKGNRAVETAKSEPVVKKKGSKRAVEPTEEKPPESAKRRKVKH